MDRDCKILILKRKEKDYLYHLMIQNKRLLFRFLGIMAMIPNYKHMRKAHQVKKGMNLKLHHKVVHRSQDFLVRQKEKTVKNHNNLI